MSVLTQLSVFEEARPLKIAPEAIYTSSLFISHAMYRILLNLFIKKLTYSLYILNLYILKCTQFTKTSKNEHKGGGDHFVFRSRKLSFFCFLSIIAFCTIACSIKVSKNIEFVFQMFVAYIVGLNAVYFAKI